MFERPRNKVDICLDHPGENEIILVLGDFSAKKNNKKQTPRTNHPRMIWPPRMIEPLVRVIILIILALLQACVLQGTAVLTSAAKDAPTLCNTI